VIGGMYVGYWCGHRFVVSEVCLRRSCGELHIGFGGSPLHFTAIVVDREGVRASNVWVLVTDGSGLNAEQTDGNGVVQFRMGEQVIREIEVDGCVLFKESSFQGGPTWGMRGVNMFVILDRVRYYQPSWVQSTDSSRGRL
jgi:hypothetical protein